MSLSKAGFADFGVKGGVEVGSESVEDKCTRPTEVLEID